MQAVPTVLHELAVLLHGHLWGCRRGRWLGLLGSKAAWSDGDSGGQLPARTKWTDERRRCNGAAISVDNGGFRWTRQSSLYRVKRPCHKDLRRRSTRRMMTADETGNVVPRKGLRVRPPCPPLRNVLIVNGFRRYVGGGRFRFRGRSRGRLLPKVLPARRLLPASQSRPHNSSATESASIVT